MRNREPGKFYCEADPRPGLWAWVLGDGVGATGDALGGANCYAAPKRQVWGDPAASLTLGELLPAGLVKGRQFQNSDRPEKRALYERLAMVLGTEGLFFHLPHKLYSAERFADDSERQGVSRLVPRSVATAVAGKTPFTAIFTHRRMPVFRDEEQRQCALGLGVELVFSSGSAGATWLRPAWGLGPDDDKGGDHYLRSVLRIIERLDFDWPSVQDREGWQRARRLFKAVNFGEQPFGAARITRVVYVKRDEESMEEIGPAMAQIGIEVVDQGRR